MRTRLRTGVAAVCAVGLLVSACGSSDDATGKVNPDYADFCLKSAELDAESKGTHGEDPAAMSDPAKMKAAWTTIVDLASQFEDVAPAKVKDDVSTLVGSILAMNEVYKEYKYNLREMSHVPAVAEKLRTIANSEDVVAASTRFRSFMQKNCGEPAT